MDGFPKAIIIARLEDVINNVNMLYRLVKPTPGKDAVESASGLVNVIPQRRAYRMHRESEIEVFKRELLKRPLVLQPVCHTGVGCNVRGMGCGMCYTDDNWVLLINQTHPKVLGRLQMGADAAKAAMKRGDPFVLQYKFGTLLERLHKELFSSSTTNEDLTHAEWDFAEITVRFPGKLMEIPSKERLKDPLFILDHYIPKCKELIFDFGDLDAEEMCVIEACIPKYACEPVQPITAEEIRYFLPGWTVNEISPLDNIGDTIPETYSYAQAGRLYESFRRKKRPNPRARSTETNSTEIELSEFHTEQATSPPLSPGVHSYQQRIAAFQQNLYPKVNISSYSPSNCSSGYREDFDRLQHRDSDRSQSTIASSGAADSGYAGHDSDGYGDMNQGHKRIMDPYSRAGRCRNQYENLGYLPDEDLEAEALRRHADLVTHMLKLRAENTGESTGNSDHHSAASYVNTQYKGNGADHYADRSLDGFYNTSDLIRSVGPSFSDSQAQPKKSRALREIHGRPVAGSSSDFTNTSHIPVEPMAESFI